jgi:hypothetical protein
MKTLNRILATAIAAAGLLGTALPAYAKLTAAEAARLGADLTPMGAEKAGNKEGTIPAWTGGLCAPPAGWTPAKGYIDPFPNDKVKFTITKANAAQYKDKLTPGTLALLAKYDNFKMPVYETRRTACYPDSVYANVRENAPKLELVGFGITGGRADVPFPIPKSGIETIYNHQQRFLGAGVLREYNSFPVRANADFYKIGAREYRIFNTSLDQPQDNLLLAFQSAFTTPATLEGTVFRTSRRPGEANARLDLQPDSAGCGALTCVRNFTDARACEPPAVGGRRTVTTGSCRQKPSLKHHKLADKTRASSGAVTPT